MLEKIGLSALESLVAALKDPNHYIRQGAAEVLRQIGNSQAVEPLVVAPKDPDNSVRWRAAAQALMQITPTRPVELLVKLASDKELAHTAIRFLS